MKPKLRYSIFFFFICVNILITLFIASPYLEFVPTAESFAEWAFPRIAFISNFGLIYLLVGVILFLLFKYISSKSIIFITSGVIIAFFNTMLFIDTIIFKLYRFHINSLVWNILMTEGSSDSVIIGQSTLINFTFYVLLIILSQFGIYFFIDRIIIKNLLKINGRAGLKYLSLILLFFIFTDKLIYAYGDLINKTYITRYAKLYPLYQPLTIKRLAKKWGYNVNQEVNFKHSKSTGLIRYPLKEIEFLKKNTLPNIVIIAIDSWRYDMLNENISPEIHSFSKESLIFDNHYSGGNATRFGIFSMFYGLYGSYWHSILSERQEPVLMEKIRKMDYNIGIWSSTQLTWPEFRKTAFIGIPEKLVDRIQGSGAKERDIQHPKLFDAWLDTINNNPFFSFLFLDAPHEPYSYPESFTKFKPSANKINYMDLNKKSDVEPFFNNYKNAVYFDDYVVGNLIKILKNRNLLKNTVVIITGDHGAEFYERGFWGHNSAFSPEQIKVPFIFYLPDEKPKKYNSLTSHLDIAPTLLELLGCITPYEEYSFGESLLSENIKQRNYVVSSGWSESAIITNDATLVFSTETYNMNTFEIRDKEYSLLSNDKYKNYFKSADINQVMFNMGKFFK